MVDSPLLLMISLPRLSNVYSLNPETVLLPPVQPLLNLNPLGSRPLPPPPPEVRGDDWKVGRAFSQAKETKGIDSPVPPGVSHG